MIGKPARRQRFSSRSHIRRVTDVLFPKNLQDVSHPFTFKSHKSFLVPPGLPQMASSTAQTQETVDATTEGSKAKPGASWKNDETHVLPKNRLPIVCARNHYWEKRQLLTRPLYAQVFFGLMACVFLAAIDQVRHTCMSIYFGLRVDYNIDNCCDGITDHRGSTRWGCRI